MALKKSIDYLMGADTSPLATDFSDPQALKAMVTENYSGVSKKIKRMKHKNAAFYEMLDFDKLRLKRRIAATLASYDRLREQVGPLCPSIPGVFSLEEDWALVNSTPVTSLEIQEERLSLAAGAAIWILDQIKADGHLEEALALLPADSDAAIPDFWDACHSSEALQGVLTVIQQRNCDCVASETGGRSKKQEDSRIFADCWTTAGTQRQAVASRQRFEALLALVPEEARQAAARHYEEKLWEWVGCYYRCRAVYAAQEQKLMKSLDRFYTKATLLAQEQKNVIARNKAAPAVLQTLTPTASLAPGLRKRAAFPPENIDLIRDIHDLGDEIMRLDGQSDALSDEISDFIFDSVSNAAAYPEQLEENYGAEIAGILSGFEVDDPYELCFAVLYLLDCGSDLPWLYFPTVNLMEHVGCCLPWSNYHYQESKDAIWNPADEEDDIPVLRRGPRRGRMPEMPDWYRLEYLDSQGDPQFQKRTNLAQIVYELTGGLMPRQLHRYDAALGELACYGITGHKALMVLNCMLLLGEARRRTGADKPDDSLPDEAVWEEVPETPPSQPEEAVEQLLETIAALKQENNKLKRAVHSASREAEDEKQKYAALEEQTQLERRELAELREIVFYQQNEFEPPAASGIEYPYTVQRRTVVFGGHDSWARAIKPMLKGDIRFIDRNMLPNADLIRHADMIWLQTNSLSHKFYNKIMDVVRTYGIPLHYFKFASAEKCAEQIVLQDCP